MKGLFKMGVLFLCIAIVLGFFLPWVRVESSQTGALTKLVYGKNQKNVAVISGIQVPLMANSEESRLVLTVAKIFTPKVEGVDKKSFLVLIIPLSAIGIFLLALFLGRNKWVTLGWGAVSLLIFLAAFYKIKTTDLEKVVLQIRIGEGMWLILYSYLALGIIGILKFINLLKKAK